MVWLHDYGKILGSTPQATVREGGRKLFELGFPQSFVDKAIYYAGLIDEKFDMDRLPIEVRIVSSADGAAHLVGPFHFLWWYENYDRPFHQLMKDGIEKTEQDWSKKIVLPEVRDSFGHRRRFLLEMLGELPEKFIHRRAPDGEDS